MANHNNIDSAIKACASGSIAWMAGNPVAANLLMFTCLIGGFLAFANIKQEVFPDMQEDTVTVRVPYPGASPEEVEQGIILAVEESIRGLEGIDEVVSMASEGSAMVRAELLENADGMKAYQDIKSEIDRITTLPEEAEEPEVTLDVHRHEVLSVVLYGDAREKTLRQLAEQIRDRFLQDPNITQVDLAGVRPLEIGIEVSQEQLRRYNLTMGQIADRLRQKSLELPGGGIKTEGGEILVRVKERRDFGREFARTPIVTASDGSTVLLGDIAEVKDDFEDSDRFATYNGQRAVMIEVYRVGDQTPLQVAGAVDELIEAVRPDLPRGIHINILSNRADIYKQRASLLLRNGAMGLCLVMLLLGTFLEIRLAFWVMMGIPISFLGSMILMSLVGLSINMVTMFAYIVALGIVVDDAIVVGENIYHQHQMGKRFLDAAIDGTREVMGPVGFSILTNIVAFIPISFMPGMMGKMLGMLPIVVISAFLISWLECIFILPAHVGHSPEREKTGIMRRIHEWQQRFSHSFVKSIRTVYGPFLQRCLSHRYIVVSIAIAMLSLTIGYVKSGRMGFELFPSVESDYAYGYAVLPYGVNVHKTSHVADLMQKAAQKVIDECGHPELVEGVFAEIGKDGSHTAEIRVFLADPEIREKIMSTQQFVDKWRQYLGEIAGVEYIRLQADRGGPGSGSSLTIELRHRRVKTLEESCTVLAAQLENFPKVTDIDDGFQAGKQQLDFKILPAGESFGIQARDVAMQVRHAYEGAEVLRQQRGRDEIKVKIRRPKSERVSEHDLDDMILRNADGKEAPLRELVSVKRGRAYTSINRRNGQRTMTVTADVRPKSATGQVITVLDTENMPALMSRYPGLTYSYEGRQAENRKSMGSLSTMIPAVLLAIYALLAIPFRSYVQPLIVMVSIPFGIVGAVIGHLIMGYSLSMIGIIGILALSGVVVNDALILVDFANRARQEEGDSPRTAIINAGIQRFRPIMLTTLTTFGGLAPMIFETSRQARFLIPIALSLGYGILFATLITLVLIPSLYLIIEDVKNLKLSNLKNSFEK